MSIEVGCAPFLTPNPVEAFQLTFFSSPEKCTIYWKFLWHTNLAKINLKYLFLSLAFSEIIIYQIFLWNLQFSWYYYTGTLCHTSLANGNYQFFMGGTLHYAHIDTLLVSFPVSALNFHFYQKKNPREFIYNQYSLSAHHRSLKSDWQNW